MGATGAYFGMFLSKFEGAAAAAASARGGVESDFRALHFATLALLKDLGWNFT